MTSGSEKHWGQVPWKLEGSSGRGKLHYLPGNKLWRNAWFSGKDRCDGFCSHGAQVFL